MEVKAVPLGRLFVSVTRIMLGFLRNAKSKLMTREASVLFVPTSSEAYGGRYTISVLIKFIPKDFHNNSLKRQRHKVNQLSTRVVTIWESTNQNRSKQYTNYSFILLVL